jgi:hypothetical protein
MSEILALAYDSDPFDRGVRAALMAWDLMVQERRALTS